jgi:hypothetical protein
VPGFGESVHLLRKTVQVLLPLEHGWGTAPRFEIRYELRKTPTGLILVRQTMAEYRLETCVIPHNQDIFVAAEVETSSQSNRLNGSYPTAQSEPRLQWGFTLPVHETANTR